MHALAGAGRVVGGRYRLRDQIGHGAMGAVWRARDELLDRDVAVKEVKIPPSLGVSDRSALYQRTLREARTAARLNHPGVVTVFDVVEEDGCPWIVMELVEARSLEQVLAQDGPLPVSRAADIGQQLVGALATAHAAGVLHRDVKPSNVLLAPDGRAVLTDFGIATFEGDARLTQTGMVMGTPAFTPPERIRGDPATPSSDLWSLGATLYAAVQGQGPYTERGGVLTTMNAVLHEDAPVASSAGRLGPVIAALMRKDPAARPDAGTASRLLSVALAEALWAGGSAAQPGGSAAHPGGAAAQPGGAAPGGPSGGGWASSAGGASRPGELDFSTAFSDAAPPDSAGGSATAWESPGAWESPAAWEPAAWEQHESWPAGEAPASGAPLYGAPVADAPPRPASATPPFSAPVADAAVYPASAAYPPSAAKVSPAYPPSAAGAPPRVKSQPGPGGAGSGQAGPARSSGHGGRVTIVACAAAFIVAAGVITGFTVMHGKGSAAADSTQRRDSSHASPAGPGSAAAPALPSGYDWYSLPAAAAGANAGFRLAIPRGWTVTRSGLTTYLRDPAGTGFMEVDLTRQGGRGPMAQARWLQGRTLAQGKFPGYRRISIRPARMLNSIAARWSFTWREAGVGRVFAQDYLFTVASGRGSQSYALYGSAPVASWRQTARSLAEAIRTFRPLT